MPHSTLQRILYIEDDEGLARLLQRRLERHRYHVDTAFSAEDGLEKIAASPYDLILLDYHLPGMNGLEALEHIAAMKPSPLVILLTASGDERVAVAALEKGAADYAVKDAGQSYFDLLPAVMQAAYTKEQLLKENERQKQELALAVERAEAANHAKSHFLATMSHEIRTPLNVVTGLTAMLARTSLNDDQAKIVQTLRSNADLLLKLINDLLDISRIEGGHVVLESNAFDVSSVLRDIEVMFEAQAQQRNITLRFEDHTDGQFFLGDRTRVQQVAMNLVGNAIKFTEHGGVYVRAGLQARGDGKITLTLTVQDSGIGIAPEKIATIFDKFTQADPTITRRYGGSGLGLSIARLLSRLMGGDITVESAPGKGSTFTASLCFIPTQKPKEAPMTHTDSLPLPAGGGTILLVEDYAPNIMVASLMLEDLGYGVVSAESGAKAIAAVTSAAHPFAAILMDVQMHGMDGLEATRRIREVEAAKGYRHTIIGVTAHALAGDRERCISAGMDDYISKPIHPDILAAKLRQYTSSAA